MSQRRRGTNEHPVYVPSPVLKMADKSTHSTEHLSSRSASMADSQFSSHCSVEDNVIKYEPLLAYDKDFATYEVNPDFEEILSVRFWNQGVEGNILDEMGDENNRDDILKGLASFYYTILMEEKTIVELEKMTIL